MTRLPHKFVLRLPNELRSRIVEASKRYRRSMNSEIIARLEHSLHGLPGNSSESAVEPALFAHIETTFRGNLSDEENQLIYLFRRLSEGQRKALLELLAG